MVETMVSALVGTIEEIWRYPVSSLGGERLGSADLDSKGISGDRTWCVVDAESGVPAAPEKEQRWQPALFLQSRLKDALPEIGFPDGQWRAVSDRRFNQKLAEHFGFAVEIRPYANGVTDTPRPPDLAINRYEPSPVHLLTTCSLGYLATIMATDRIDVRRFRPTILLRTHATPEFVERSWIGQDLRVGLTLLRAREETKRCGMTLIAQPGLVEEPEVLRSVVRHNKRNFGIYCTITTPGTVAVGDAAYLIDD